MQRANGLGGEIDGDRAVRRFGPDRADDERAELRYGDLIECSLFVRPPRPPRNPGVFDFQTWLERQRIYLVGSLGRTDYCQIIDRNRANPVRSLSLRLRERFSAALQAGLGSDPRRAGVLAGMVIGDRAEIPPDTYAAFQQTGAFHVFAISGLHVGLVTTLVIMFFGSPPRRLRAIWWTMRSGTYGGSCRGRSGTQNICHGTSP